MNDVRNSFSDPQVMVYKSEVWSVLCFCVLDRSLESVARSRQESLSSVEEDDYDTLVDIDSDKNIVRTKVLELVTNTTVTTKPVTVYSLTNLCPSQKFLCVSDLARKDKRILSKKYQIYFWWVSNSRVRTGSVCVFYTSSDYDVCVFTAGTSLRSLCSTLFLSSSWSSPIRRYQASVRVSCHVSIGLHDD